MLHSIQQIAKVYDTGDHPVLVECDDLKDYVCKHNSGQRVAKKLFAEWMCHGLLQGLHTRVPNKELVSIKEEHVVPTSVCQPHFFKVPCFATEFLKESVEWALFEFANNKSLVNVDDLMTIAFCDLWLGNDDRNWNNFNLLSNPIKGGWEIVPIDHGACLNSLIFSESTPLELQTEDDSLIFTDHFRKLVQPRFKNMKQVGQFIDSLYLHVSNLENVYDEEVLAMPKEWQIPSSLVDALKGQLFDKEWLDVTKLQFLKYIKASIFRK